MGDECDEAIAETAMAQGDKTAYDSAFVGVIKAARINAAEQHFVPARYTPMQI